jgi:hypothetical protein
MFSTELYLTQNKLVQVTSEKFNKTLFLNENNVIINFVYCFNLLAMLKNTFFCSEINLLIVIYNF